MDYASLQTVALTLIKDAGQLMTLRRITAGTYSDGTAPITRAAQSVYGAILAYTDFEQQNALIESNDSRVLLPAKGLTGGHPNEADEVIDAAGKVYRVVRVQKVSPAGIDVLYDLQVRG